MTDVSENKFSKLMDLSLLEFQNELIFPVLYTLGNSKTLHNNLFANIQSILKIVFYEIYWQ